MSEIENETDYLNTDFSDEQVIMAAKRYAMKNTLMLFLKANRISGMMPTTQPK